jgi:hypothetical protein
MWDFCIHKYIINKLNYYAKFGEIFSRKDDLKKYSELNFTIFERFTLK